MDTADLVIMIYVSKDYFPKGMSKIMIYFVIQDYAAS